MLQLNSYPYDSKENFFNSLDESPKFSPFEIHNFNQNKFESSPKMTQPQLTPFKVEVFDNNSNKSKEENEDINNSKRIFKVIYPKKISLFTDVDIEEKNSKNYKYNFKKRIKSKNKMKRYKCPDNMRKMIKRRFINTYLKKALNEKLLNVGFHSFFEYLPQSFVGKVIQSEEKQLLDMTLFDIFGKKELYGQKNSANYSHNLKLLEQIKSAMIPELNVILNKKYSEIFEAYVNSEEFNIHEINRLKNSKSQKQQKDDYFIEKYKYLAMHYIEFCSK